MIRKDGLFFYEGMTQSDRCIHTPSAFARQNLLYVQEVGRLESLKPHKCIRGNLNSFLFMVVLEGKGSLEVAGRQYDMQTGNCALVDCMEHYEHISDKQEAWKLAWVHFNGHAARGYYELFKKCNQQQNVFLIDNVSECDSIVGEILTEQKKMNFRAELNCGELLLKLLNYMIANVSNAQVIDSEQEKESVNELRELLNVQYADADVMRKIAADFGEDLEALEARFIKQFGIDIEGYINNRRLNVAKELLRFSIKSVEDVAKEAGIGDLAVMQKMFRENEGMLAEEYRAKWAAWIR